MEGLSFDLDFLRCDVVPLVEEPAEVGGVLGTGELALVIMASGCPECKCWLAVVCSC